MEHPSQAEWGTKGVEISTADWMMDIVVDPTG
jgi:hypothetical protein